MLRGGSTHNPDVLGRHWVCLIVLLLCYSNTVLTQEQYKYRPKYAVLAYPKLHLTRLCTDAIGVQLKVVGSGGKLCVGNSLRLKLFAVLR